MRRRLAIASVAAIAAWVLPAIAPAEGGLLAVRRRVSADQLAATNDVAKGRVELEANELVDLHRTAKGLPEPTRAEVQRLIRQYLELVAGREWSAMARGERDGFDEGDRLHILYVVHDLDDCFRGAFQVPRAAFERAQRSVTRADRSDPAR